MIRIKVYTKFGWKYGRISIKRKHFSFIHFHHIWLHAEMIYGFRWFNAKQCFMKDI